MYLSIPLKVSVELEATSVLVKTNALLRDKDEIGSLNIPLGKRY